MSWVPKLLNLRTLAFILTSVVFYCLIFWTSILFGIQLNNKLYFQIFEGKIYEIDLNMKFEDNRLEGLLLLDPLFIEALCSDYLNRENLNQCQREVHGFDTIGNRHCSNFSFCLYLSKQATTDGPLLEKHIYELQVELITFSKDLVNNLSLLTRALVWETNTIDGQDVQALSNKLSKVSYSMFDQKPSSIFDKLIMNQSSNGVFESKKLVVDTKFSEPPQSLKFSVENLPESFITKSITLKFIKKDSWVVGLIYDYRKIIGFVLVLYLVYLVSCVFFILWLIYVLFKISEYCEEKPKLIKKE